MASSTPSGPKMAHVNLMTDAIIANLPEDALRSVLRAMLATDPSITSTFEARTRDYLLKSKWNSPADLFALDSGSEPRSTEHLRGLQQRIRVMIGCGMCFDSLPLLADLVVQTSSVPMELVDTCLDQLLSSFDGDIIQALTAVTKTLFTRSGYRLLTSPEESALAALKHSLSACHTDWHGKAKPFPFERSLAALRTVPGMTATHNLVPESPAQRLSIPALPTNIETFELSGRSLPRLFSGLWQLSSPSWGIASIQKIEDQFRDYASQGFTAYDMADHYGDAEIVFGEFRASCTNPQAIFGATKYCIFTPITITEAIVSQNIAERCHRMASDHVDLLQFHWQDYNDPQYLQTLRYLQQDERVHALGLCNFDSQRMEEIVEAGIKIQTNQVQFSLIDSRPVFKMSQVCSKYNIILLTYGTLCGGFIAAKWLGQAEPELFLQNVTPSQRKYYEMIVNWGGWGLFQDLLRVLKSIATKHCVSIPNVATRWILDFPFVGAVIVGTRMGVSGHAVENLKTYGWRLDEEDQEMIEGVLVRSKRDQLIGLLGDCGGEYR